MRIRPPRPQHLEALERPRRIIFQDDVLANDAFRTRQVGPERLRQIISFYMSRLDEKPNQIDSIWFEWGEGNTAVWPSQILPRTENVFPRWWEAGIDPVEVLLSEARKRGREVFFSYRINGSDNDDLFDPPHSFDQPIPLKAQHPDWLIHKWHPFWDFSCAGVRALKLEVVREVARMYDFDGIHIDFARIPVLFPAGQQWSRRDLLTEFMRQLRAALLEIEQQRGRALLLAARVPENLPGCHFDGLDLEAWIDEFLIDILVLGTRTATVDIAAFRRLARGTPIKLYPSWDNHHSSDGYRETDLEIWRGVCANWWRQNPDGMHTFNLMLPSPQAAQNSGARPAPGWPTQRRVFAEIGNPETLKFKDKVFFVERRGGGHAQPVVPAPDNWHTPRHMYFQTNMLASLPTPLNAAGGADALLRLEVADEVSSAAAKIAALTLHLAISPEVPKALSTSADLEQIASLIEVRINNILLGTAHPETVSVPQGDFFKHWLVVTVDPNCLASGANLVGARLRQPPAAACGRISLEKLELHLCYK